MIIYLSIVCIGAYVAYAETKSVTIGIIFLLIGLTALATI